tara:strand:+ start:556 stop:1245 length:690 start_codon:yes stop_codon:yes gene_type:complete
MKKILCTICMRGGSNEIKNKNLIKINRKHLMYFTISQAKKSKLFDNIVVSTDSNKISNIAKKYGASSWYKRPKNLSTSYAPKIPVIRHTLKESENYFKKKYDFIFDLDVTSPLRTISDIKNAFKFFLKKKADILITGSKSQKNPYFNIVKFKKGIIKKVMGVEAGIKRRQDAPTTYDMNASIYIWKRDVLLKSKTLFRKKTVFYEMPRERSVDIDSKFDLMIVKHLLKK